MISAENISLLGLSKKEISVLSSLKEELNTPLKIERDTKVSRTGVYDILISLKSRGIVESRIENGKKYWRILPRKKLEDKFYESKRALLGISEGTQEVYGIDDASVTIHRGKDAVRQLMNKIFLEHENERLYGFQGDVAAINWNNVFSVKETNSFNRAIKKKGIIVEAILPAGWLERQTKELGVEWAKDFEGRTTRVNIIGQEYFKHGGQLFIFKNSIYLVALGEELVIEIKNSEIQKMLLSFFRFIQENADLIDANEVLRDLIAKGKVKP